IASNSRAALESSSSCSSKVILLILSCFASLAAFQSNIKIPCCRRYCSNHSFHSICCLRFIVFCVNGNKYYKKISTFATAKYRDHFNLETNNLFQREPNQRYLTSGKVYFSVFLRTSRAYKDCYF